MKQVFQHDKILIEEAEVHKARRLRLKKAREATGKSPQEIVALVGIPIVSDNLYYDLEDHNGQLNMVMSLGELSKLSSILGICTRYIFDGKTEKQKISLEQLSAQIKRHLEKTQMSIADFENRVGFVIAPTLENPKEALYWNVDCLRFVCTEIGINWLDVLP
jgi:hypothetical protein